MNNDLLDDESILFLNIISDGKEDPHSVTMALQLAGHAIDYGKKVVLFFNVRAVTVPTKNFPDDLAFHDKPIKSLLKELMAKGANVQVCPHCMKALNVKAEDLIEGAQVTDREKLFSQLGSNTNVFTY
jgi:predicted peroxiredoxin